MSRPALDRSGPPKGGEVRLFRFPPFRRIELPGGLTVLAARLGGFPLVSLELVTPSGGQFDPPGRSGLATLTASAIDEGTRARDSIEIAAQAERLGGFLSVGADWDAAYLSTGSLSRHRRQGLELLAEVATSPTFPESEVERLRTLRLSEILRRGHDPSFLAERRFSQTVYAGTVYETPLLGAPESVAGLDRRAIVDFYRRHWGLRGAVLVGVGDLDPEELARDAEELLGAAAPAGPPPPAPEIRPPARGGLEVHIVDRPGAAQTELRLGQPGVTRTDPDYIPLIALNTLLGGKFTSRINLNLRERHGFTYGASSRFVPRRGPGPFLVSTAVATESTGAAAREVISELRRVREELVEPAELEETRNYVIGVFPYTVQTIGELVKRLETLAVYGLPDDYFESYLERIAAVSREQIREVARRHLAPEQLVIVAVGPADALEPQFDGLAPVKVWSQEGELRAAPATP
jgi:zinc protease